MDTAKNARVEVVEKDGRPTIVLEGAIDIFFAADLRRAAVEVLQKSEDVALCCDKVERFDTAALQVLLALKRDLAQNGRTLQVSGMSARPAAAVGLAGLSGQLL